MSDYLANLISRTVSADTLVRPQLPFIFEPTPADRQAKSEFELERETTSGPPPVMRREEKSTSTPLADPPPRQSFSHEPEPIAARISRAKGNVHTSEEPELAREDVTRSSTSRRREDKLVPDRGETSVVPVAEKPKALELPKNPVADHSSSSRGNEAQTPVSQPATRNPQPKSQSLLTSAARIEKFSAVQPVVPSVRALPQVPPTPPPPSPTINVSIGRVEIRAASPPAPQRARPKPATVLSLEDYLRQRANGGKR